jgi:hypothetical protein
MAFDFKGKDHIEDTRYNTQRKAVVGDIVRFVVFEGSADGAIRETMWRAAS